MTVVDIMKCAKPLIFENEDEVFGYSIHGTVFLARFNRKLFGITAKHNLRTRSNESVRLELEPGDRTFLPLQFAHFGETEDEDSDFADIAFFEIDRSQLDLNAICSDHFLALDVFYRRQRALVANQFLAIRGYPSEMNTVDYDRRTIHTRAYATDGSFVGPGESAHCSIIRFADLSYIHDADGLSGSPIMAFIETPEGYDCFFAGVLIRATKSSSQGRFIDAPVIFRALQRLSI